MSLGFDQADGFQRMPGFYGPIHTVVNSNDNVDDAAIAKDHTPTHYLQCRHQQLEKACNYLGHSVTGSVVVSLT
eukprot:m.205811 g.205811  ORF g.205811 m.205811 type:complete len:74 (+) comp18882_c0_seq3:1488-1709(+)